jgi:hypothetical protein
MSKKTLFAVSIILACGLFLSLSLFSLSSKGTTKLTIKLTDDQIREVKAGGGAKVTLQLTENQLQTILRHIKTSDLTVKGIAINEKYIQADNSLVLIIEDVIVEANPQPSPLPLPQQ